MRRQLLVGAVAALLVICGARADDKTPAKAPSAAEVRKVAERGLAAVETGGLAWWKVRKCNGCHHGGFMLWSHYEAQRRGFAVDDAKLQAWTKQAFDFYLAKSKEHEAGKNGHVEGMSLLLGRPTVPMADAKQPSPLKTTTDLVVIAQRDDGSYKYAGQGLKRTDLENEEVTTLWSALALSWLDKDGLLYLKHRERALEWLKKTPVGASNEALVLRLLVESQVGDPTKTKGMIEQLKKQQNADGGWSWTKDRPSEAYSTGQSLYALGRMGQGESDAAVQRGWAFLVGKQKKDGSWDSPSRKPEGKENAIAHYWGTAWATLGLVRTLPEGRK